MRVILDLTWTSDPENAIHTVLGLLDAACDKLTVTCRATDTERAIWLRTWFAKPRDSSTILEKPLVWQPSGLDAIAVDGSLLYGVITPLRPDVIVSNLLAQLPARTIPVIAIDVLAELSHRESMLRVGQAPLREDQAHHGRSESTAGLGKQGNRLKLALLSPFPPARSGIADCSAELVGGLREYYDVTLIDTVPDELRDWDDKTLEPEGLRPLDWFQDNAHLFDRVVYQLGNSGYHAGMWPTMAKIPGVSALHDMFQGDYLASEQKRQQPQMWPEILLYEHGYRALACAKANHREAVLAYAGNYRVFRDSLGVVLHSRYALSLAMQQIGSAVSQRAQVIPLVRQACTAPTEAQQNAARRALGLAATGTVVCSFGYIGPSKLPLKLLEAWRQSDLANDPGARLIFVGRNHPGPIGQAVNEAIAALPHPEHVQITGFVNSETFTNYLRAASFAVQLRAFSRGETSGAVLHAMSHGLPQVVNANGAFAELDTGAVWMLPDPFTTAELVEALHGLHHDSALRQKMALRGPIVIEQQHSPAVCAKAYYEFVETCYAQRQLTHPQALAQDIQNNWSDGLISPQQRGGLANAVDFNRALHLPRPRLLLDLTSTYNSDMQTGIQRVALALFDALMELEPEGLTVTPIYLQQTQGQWEYRQANAFMSKRLSLDEHWLTDHVIMPRDKDVLLTLDLSTWQVTQAKQQGLYRHFQACGVRCYSIVYDLLPVTLPGTFPAMARRNHEDWLSAVCQFDGAICISKYVASELVRWRQSQSGYEPNFRVGSFVLGSDPENFGLGGSPNLEAALQWIENTRGKTNGTHQPPTFLMVGTIEPRKGYLEVLLHFTALWESGFEGRLVIVGREGWTHLKDHERKDIPETVNQLRHHPERYKRLLWLGDADDAVLRTAYGHADCLLAASYDEGFGLPIVEATRHGVPVLARDIAVFREVAPPGTVFFEGGQLGTAIKQWTKPAQPPPSENTITWQESAQQVLTWLQAQ